MSSKNAPHKDALNRNQRRNMNREKAREQARLLREQEQAKKKRTRIIAASVGAVIIVAVIALVVVLVKNSNATLSTGSDGLEHTDKIITSQIPNNVTEYGGISLGKELNAGTKNQGVPQVDIYFDYTCIHCEHLGTEYDAALAEAAKKGDITLVYHPVVIHKDYFFPYTGAGAEFFVASNEPDKYFAFHKLMHEKLMTPLLNGKINEPTPQDIVAIAREAGLRENSRQALLEELTAIETDLQKGTSSSSLLIWIQETTDQFIADSEKATGGAGTPTVLIDGEKVDWKTAVPELLNK